MNNILHNCPVCNRKMDANSLFPAAVCNTCRERATDEHGEPVVFYHARFIGKGYVGYYRRNKELIPFTGNTCYIHGVECQAMDDQNGGIVILPIYDPFEKRSLSILPGSVRRRNARVS